MFTILEKCGLPIPSKLTIILCVALLLSILLNLSQCKKINDKDEIIKGKEVEISVQNSTIKTLQTETQKSIDKINAMNDRLAKAESDYQIELDKLISEMGKCKSDEPASEIEESAQKSFQSVIDGLANSTVKKRVLK